VEAQQLIEHLMHEVRDKHREAMAALKPRKVTDGNDSQAALPERPFCMALVPRDQRKSVA